MNIYLRRGYIMQDASVDERAVEPRHLRTSCAGILHLYIYIYIYIHTIHVYIYIRHLSLYIFMYIYI